MRRKGTGIKRFEDTWSKCSKLSGNQNSLKALIHHRSSVRYNKCVEVTAAARLQGS